MPELTELEMLTRVLLAAGLGAAIGIERELDAQPAGFRTHVLIALGAALFGLISIQGFNEFATLRGATNVNIDVTRVASQVVVGVGFLGGGAIIKWGASIRGLTTAASIWVVAAIGLAAGLGYATAAATVTVAVLVSLVALRIVRRHLRRWARSTATVIIRLRPGASPGPVMRFIDDIPDATARSIRLIDRDEDHGAELIVQLKSGRGTHLPSHFEALTARDDIEEIELGDR